MSDYESDYQCQSNDGPDDPCHRVATQVFREPWTKAAYALLVCDEHSGDPKAMGYTFDQEGTIQLARDVERELERLTSAV